MESDYKVRKASKPDLEQMKVVISETELFPAEMLDDMISPFFKEPEKNHIWLVAECNSEVVAIAYCEPERMTEGTYNLLAIGVRKALQGKKIGKLLIKQLEKILAGRKTRVLLVETMDTPEFELTREFYPKNGFVEEARIREYYEAGAGKVIFWKSLV